MDQFFEFIAKYGTTAGIGAAALYIITKWLGKQTIFVSIGKPENGNGKLTKSEVAELINTHHSSCSTDLYKHIDEFNRALGRIEGHLEAKK